MKNYVLAQLNIAKMLYPLDSFEMRDFVDNLDRINALAERSDGFVWRLIDEDDNTEASIFGHDFIVNLSTWTDIDSLHNFVYRTAHTEVLRRRKEWFSQVKTYSVMWWHDSNSTPSTAQASARLEQLGNNGPTAEAFTFTKSWPKPGI